MAKAYTKEFLVEVYMSRFINLPSATVESLCTLEENAIKLYDRVGKDEFRKYADLTPERIREARLAGV